MRKLLFVLLLVAGFVNAQEYKIGSAFVAGNFIKYDRDIKVMDDKVEIVAPYKGAETPMVYDVVKKVNGKIYITDGVETHDIIIRKSSGKKKGFKYDYEVFFKYDSRNPVGTITYYCVLKE